VRRSIDNAAVTLLEAARRNPEAAPTILAEASRRFRGYAKHPMNVRATKLLHAMADEFEAAAALSARGGELPTSDDMDEAVAETAAAYESTAGDDMDVEARRRQLHDVVTDEPRTNILPEVGDDRIGNIATFKYQPTPAEIDNKIFETMTMALLQGTKEQAQAITVDVFVVNQPPALTPGSGIFSSPRCRPYGVVQYGSDGATGSVRFDVGLGRRFTVGGNYVSLLLGMDQPPGWTTTNRNAGQMILGASLAFFAAPTAAPVMLTSYLDTSLAALGTQTVPVPAKAAFLLPPQSDNIAGSTQIDFYDMAGVLYYSLQFVNGTVVSPIPLANDTVQVVVTNLGPGGARYRLMWQLAL